jgi:nitroreductase
VLVLVVVDPQAYVQRYAADDKASTGLGHASADWPVPYWFVDGGAAVMGMLLAAEAAGLGALFFGQFDHESAVAAEFGVPDGCRSVGTVALGWPAPGGREPTRSAATGRPGGPGFVHRGSW